MQMRDGVMLGFTEHLEGEIWCSVIRSRTKLSEPLPAGETEHVDYGCVFPPSSWDPSSDTVAGQETSG